MLPMRSKWNRERRVSNHRHLRQILSFRLTAVLEEPRVDLSPIEQLLVTFLTDSGNFDEFETPPALRKVDVADKSKIKKAPRRE